MSDSLALLAAADPVREAELPGAAAPQARALKERILRADVVVAQPSRRRPAVVAVAVAAAVAAAVMVPRSLEREPVAAAAVLERAAVATASAAPAPAGRYAYTEATTITPATDTDEPPFTALVPAVQETWIAADGSGRIRTVRGKPYFPSERDRSRWLAHGSPPLGLPPGSITVEPLPVSPDAAALAERDPATLDARELDELLNTPAFLPTDPDRLERLLQEYAKTKDPPAESMMFNQLEDLLTNPYVSAALRSAAYRVLARMNGIDLRGPMRDPMGRPGTAIDFPAGSTGDMRYRLIIDPATGAVLAEETLLGQPNDEVAGAQGTVLAQVVYVRSGWVDSVGSRPAARR